MQLPEWNSRVVRTVRGGTGLPTGGELTTIPAFGAWIPFLPPGLRRRLAAQDVVETLLSICAPGEQEAERGYDVVARNTSNGVMVAFVRPGSSGDRVEIGPISDELLG